MSGYLLPDLPIFILDEENSMVSSSLSTLRGNKAMVLDFWHTKCTRCPAALDKLNTEAGDVNDDDIIFVSCALSQGEGNHEVASSLVTDGSLENMTHVFMDLDVKESAKSVFGYTAVPFYVIIDKGGNVIGSGDPKSLDYKNLIKHAGSSVPAPTPATVPVPVPAAQNAFSLDEDF